MGLWDNFNTNPNPYANQGLFGSGGLWNSLGNSQYSNQGYKDLIDWMQSNPDTWSKYFQQGNQQTQTGGQNGSAFNPASLIGAGAKTIPLFSNLLKGGDWFSNVGGNLVDVIGSLGSGFLGTKDPALGKFSGQLMSTIKNLLSKGAISPNLAAMWSGEGGPGGQIGSAIGQAAPSLLSMSGIVPGITSWASAPLGLVGFVLGNMLTGGQKLSKAELKKLELNTVANQILESRGKSIEEEWAKKFGLNRLAGTEEWRAPTNINPASPEATPLAEKAYSKEFEKFGKYLSMPLANLEEEYNRLLEDSKIYPNYDMDTLSKVKEILETRRSDPYMDPGGWRQALTPGVDVNDIVKNFLENDPWIKKMGPVSLRKEYFGKAGESVSPYDVLRSVLSKAITEYWASQQERGAEGGSGGEGPGGSSA